MSLALVNGLLTSIILETIILLKQMGFKIALKTALGMSFISMVGMELSMNITDAILTGGAILTWWAIPIMLFLIAQLTYYQDVDTQTVSPLMLLTHLQHD